MAKKTAGNGLRCAMCGATDSVSTPVVEIMPGLALCTDCISYIDNAAQSELSRRNAEAPKTKKSEKRSIPKPKEIKKFLDQYIIGQDEAKKYMSVAV